MKGRVVVLLAACAGLGWLNLQQAEGGPWPPPAAGPGDGAAASVAGRAPVAVPPAPARAGAAWQEQVARPLFAATRRPPEPPAAPVAQVAPEPEPPAPAAASGVVLRPDGGLALLRLADDRVVRAAEGEEVEGWLVSRISAEGVEVSRGGQVVLLAVRMAAAEGLGRVAVETGEEAKPVAATGGGRAARPRPVRGATPRAGGPARAL